MNTSVWAEAPPRCLLADQCPSSYTKWSSHTCTKWKNKPCTKWRNRQGLDNKTEHKAREGAQEACSPESSNQSSMTPAPNLAYNRQMSQASHLLTYALSDKTGGQSYQIPLTHPRLIPKGVSPAGEVGCVGGKVRVETLQKPKGPIVDGLSQNAHVVCVQHSVHEADCLPFGHQLCCASDDLFEEAQVWIRFSCDATGELCSAGHHSLRPE